MPSCIVNWCRTHIDAKQGDIYFHYFPKNEQRRLAWVDAVRRELRNENWMPSKHCRICSIHFDESDYVISKTGRHFLKVTAVPNCSYFFDVSDVALCRQLLQEHGRKATSETSRNYNEMYKNCMIFSQETQPQLQDYSKSNMKPDVKAKPRTEKDVSLRKHKLINSNIQCPNCYCQFSVQGNVEADDESPPKVMKIQAYNFDNLMPTCSSPTKMSASDIESAFNSPKKQVAIQQLRRKTNLAEKRLSKIKSLQRRNQMLMKRNISIENVVLELKKRQLKVHTRLDGFAGDLVSSLQKKQSQKGKRTFKFTPAIKKFALTLNYYSPAGYKYVRRQLNLCLPHPSTLAKWYQCIEGGPGFTKETFRALKLKYAQSDKRLACLMVDEMAIRQQRIFNGNGFDGHVTFGGDGDIATQAYVLMLVSLNDSFKLPLGYFFVNGLAAGQRSNIIKMCLGRCHDAGAEVVSLTFDGCSSNFATAKLLGCNFEDPSNLKTHFDHPSTGKPVVLILDPCHMLKLVRNIFEAKKTITDQNGDKVQWKYLQKLKLLQDNIGLHLANKLSESHLKFRNNIMNVKLATQTLSHSVASALKLCAHDLNMPDFQDADATIRFIEIMNDLFDVLNSRSLDSHGLKHPFSINEKKQRFQFLDKAIAYIKGLKIDVQTKKTRQIRGQKVTVNAITQNVITKTQSKTGFIGLLINIESLKMLFTELVEKRQELKFILPYKFSQDHLELFFGVIRNHGRCNNNPNAKQFMGIYKKTLLHLELRSKFTGNCIPLEDIPILNCSSAINKSTPGYRKKYEEDDVFQQNKADTEMHNCSVFSSILDTDRPLPETIEQIVGYIAGFVAKKIHSKLHCTDCVRLLFASEKLYFHKLISIKDFGGLAYSSALLFKICTRSERVLREIVKINKNENKSLYRANNLKVILNQCQHNIIGISDILLLLQSSHPHDSTHAMLLLKTIIEEFLKIRLHYMAKKDSLLNSNRQKLNKLVIFRGT